MDVVHCNALMFDYLHSPPLVVAEEAANLSKALVGVADIHIAFSFFVRRYDEKQVWFSPAN